jgi:single-strand DNA-binding protein
MRTYKRTKLGGITLNSIQIIGNISTDIDLKATNSGKFVAGFNIAVNNPYNREKVSFLPVEIWGKSAENTGNYCSKGSKVGITGHIEVDQWEKDGQKRYKTKVVANQIEFLTPKGQSGNQSNNQNSNQQQTRVDNDPFADDGKPIDIRDSDLPF